MVIKREGKRIVDLPLTFPFLHPVDPVNPVHPVFSSFPSIFNHLSCSAAGVAL